jgi:tetratricopeptide (TPR) repeat protein
MQNNLLKTIGKPLLWGWLALSCALAPSLSYAADDSPAKAEDGVDPADRDSSAQVEKKPDSAQVPSKDSAVSFGNFLAGRFAESQGDSSHGIQYLRDSLKRDPENKDVQKSLYRLLVFAGNIDEAMPLARKLEGVKVVDDGSEFAPEMLLALEEAKNGEYQKAEKHIAAIPQTGFKSLQVPLMRAWLKLGAGEIKKPVEAKTMSPDGHIILPHVYLNAALINDIAGFDDEAQKQYEASVKDSRIEPFRAVEALANFYERKGMNEKREKLINEYLSAHGDSYLADELLLRHREGHAAPLVGDARAGLAEVFYTMANIFHGVRAPGDEIAILHLALYLRPDYPSAQFLLASAYELGQDYKSAVSEYKTIKPDSPYYARGRIRAVYDEIELGQKDVALEQLDAIAGERPKDFDALLAKGDILRAQKRYHEAVEAYDAALKRVATPVKQHWVIYFARGATYQLLGRWNNAEEDMNKALALNPTEPEVLNYLGYSWLTMNRNIDRAKKMIEDAYDARPEDAHIIDSMGYAMYVTGDFASAEEYFDQALERTPNDPTVNDHLGDTYWQLGRKTEARYQWERALGDEPDQDTKKGLRKKLKEGLAIIHSPETAQEKNAKPPADE